LVNFYLVAFGAEAGRFISWIESVSSFLNKTSEKEFSVIGFTVKHVFEIGNVLANHESVYGADYDMKFSLLDYRWRDKMLMTRLKNFFARISGE